MAMGATHGETIFFTWIRAVDGLEHAVRDPELAAAITPAATDAGTQPSAATWQYRTGC